MPQTLSEVRPTRLVTVTGADRAASVAWNGFTARWHYLGHTPLIGAQMRYAVEDREGRSPVERTPRRLHRMIAGGLGAQPPAGDQQLQIPDHAPDPDPESGIVHPLRGAPVAAVGLERALQGETGPDGDLRRGPVLHRAAYIASGWIHVGTT